MKEIQARIEQLKLQLDDPEILDKRKIENKLEAYKECLQILESNK